jgi:hypothetical protein
MFVVPTQPLTLLLASPATADLISPRPSSPANVGLWRIRVFNQLVTMQGHFNMQHLTEIKDMELPESRRDLLALSAQDVSRMVHRYGIGEANVQGGWYQRLKAAIRADLDRLETEQSRKLLTWRGRAWRLAIGDASVVGAAHRVRRPHRDSSGDLRSSSVSAA